MVEASPGGSENPGEDHLTQTWKKESSQGKFPACELSPKEHKKYGRH